ncbi:MAG: glycosyltransferase family 4 protein [bacterium]|nr:glycosyltransferase family 4 protein [bacterium]
MDGSRKSLSVSPAELAGTDKESLPRILYVGCDGFEGDDPAPLRSYGAKCLRNEDWPIGFCPVAGTARDLSTGSAINDLLARLAAKTEYIRHLVRQIPRYDVVHVHGGPSKDLVRLALPALILARFFGRKTVLHLTSADTERFLDSRGGWFHPLLKASDAIVVGSRYLQKAVGRSHLRSDILIRPVDVKDFTHRVRHQLQPRILVESDLEPGKNVACALKAFRLVKQKYPRAELTVAGDGPQFDFLHRMAAGLKLHGISFTGSVTNDEMGSLYDEHDLFVASASQDESPTSLVRAFAAGLPIVATDADGVLHMLRDRTSALIVPINDHASTADRVIELIEDDELTGRLSRQGREEIRKYTWTRVRQDWVNLYRKLASRSYT